MLGVMLDTNVLVSFALIYSKYDKKQSIPKPLQRTEKLLGFYEWNLFENYMSLWNQMEFRQILMEIKFEQKLIELGFATREFRSARREINLEKNEKDLVNEGVWDIWMSSTKETHDLDLVKIRRLSKEGFHFIDLVLLDQAQKSKCEYFVTNEEFLKNNKDKLKSEFDIEIIGVKGCLSELNKRIDS